MTEDMNWAPGIRDNGPEKMHVFRDKAENALCGARHVKSDLDKNVEVLYRELYSLAEFAPEYRNALQLEILDDTCARCWAMWAIASGTPFYQPK